MKTRALLSLRWGAIVAVGLVIATLGILRYMRDVSAISPEQFLRDQPAQTVRVVGTVQAGSLVTDTALHTATFYLSGEREGFSVRYTGEDLDTLRELKTLVVVGRWDLSTGTFVAQGLALVPNYGFVVAAYLFGVIPMGFFLFRMERRVDLLYTEIKEAQAYELKEEGCGKG